METRTAKPIPAWVPRVRRVLEILASGGFIWLTEPKPDKKH